MKFVDYSLLCRNIPHCSYAIINYNQIQNLLGGGYLGKVSMVNLSALKAFKSFSSWRLFKTCSMKLSSFASLTRLPSWACGDPKNPGTCALFWNSFPTSKLEATGSPCPSALKCPTGLWTSWCCCVATLNEVSCCCAVPPNPPRGPSCASPPRQPCP